MYGEMEMELIQEQPPKKEVESPRETELELANRVMFYVPGQKLALLIYDQSPVGFEADFLGSLPEGKFHHSGMIAVTRDPNQEEEEYTMMRTRAGSFAQRAISVDEEMFLRIAMQGIYPEYAKSEHRSDYMVVDIYDQSRTVKDELIRSIRDFHNGSLSAQRQDLLLAAIKTCKDTVVKNLSDGNDKGPK